MNNKLILRALTSPFPTPYSDTTKGSVLSHADVDNNFIYLKGNIIYSAQTSGTILTLYKINGDILQFNIAPSGATVNKYVETVNLIANTSYTITHNLGLDVSVDVKNLGTNEQTSITIDNYTLTSVDITSVSDIPSARIIIIG